MDITLYYCTKCAQGFNYKSRVSGHHNACPNKNGPDLYQPCVPYDKKIEETFKRRVAIPVNIPQGVLNIAEEEMEKDIEAAHFGSMLEGQLGEQGGASSLLASAKPQGSIPPQVLTGEPQQQPEQGVGELLQQMSEGRLSTKAIEINPEESESVEKLMTVENVFEEEK